MIKEELKPITFHPFDPEADNLKNNKFMFSNFIEEKSIIFNKDIDSHLKTKENKIESEQQNENHEIENEYLDENSKDFINKNIIDLSFLDTANNDEEEKNINHEDISFKNNIPLLNINYNQCNNSIYKEYLQRNKKLYKMQILKNIYQNYNYYHQMAFINNLMHNYQQMNNQNIINQTFSNKNKKYPKQHKNSNKVKKTIDKKYLINLIDIKANKEKRTTVRMMNIPSYFRPSDLAKKLDEKFGITPEKENRVYDFIYIPLKEKKNNEISINAGYAFINFVHPKHILKFYSFFHGKHLKLKTIVKKFALLPLHQNRGKI